MKLSLTHRIVLTVLCFGIALVGFMVKLPPVFRHHDTELHTLFYFVAAVFLNVLFVKRNLVGHVLAFLLLYAMGVAIEYAQEYSNSLVTQRSHGRYDPEDIKANLEGLVYFSILWVGYIAMYYLIGSKRLKTVKTELSPATPVRTNATQPSKEIKPSSQLFINPQDEQKMQKAVQLLTEVMNENPGHPVAAELQAIIRRLKERL
jgi:hypothetical protein